jgi:radical SAM superfamily enzyme YgiQ (UPF0313 family)
MQLTVTLLLGIAGRQKSLQHARATGKLISAMDPDFASALTLMLIPGTPLWKEYESGDFQLPHKKGLLVEMKEMLIHTHLSHGLFSSNHASNYLPLRAWLPDGKQALLDSIDAALSGEIGLKPEWMRAF